MDQEEASVSFASSSASSAASAAHATPAQVPAPVQLDAPVAAAEVEGPAVVNKESAPAAADGTVNDAVTQPKSDMVYPPPSPKAAPEIAPVVTGSTLQSLQRTLPMAEASATVMKSRASSSSSSSSSSASSGSNAAGSSHRATIPAYTAMSAPQQPAAAHGTRSLAFVGGASPAGPTPPPSTRGIINVVGGGATKILLESEARQLYQRDNATGRASNGTRSLFAAGGVRVQSAAKVRSAAGIPPVVAAPKRRMQSPRTRAQGAPLPSSIHDCSGRGCPTCDAVFRERERSEKLTNEMVEKEALIRRLRVSMQRMTQRVGAAAVDPMAAVGSVGAGGIITRNVVFDPAAVSASAPAGAAPRGGPGAWLEERARSKLQHAEVAQLRDEANRLRQMFAESAQAQALAQAQGVADRRAAEAQAAVRRGAHLQQVLTASEHACRHLEADKAQLEHELSEWRDAYTAIKQFPVYAQRLDRTVAENEELRVRDAVADEATATAHRLLQELLLAHRAELERLLIKERDAHGQMRAAHEERVRQLEDAKAAARARESELLSEIYAQKEAAAHAKAQAERDAAAASAAHAAAVSKLQAEAAAVADAHAAEVARLDGALTTEKAHRQAEANAHVDATQRAHAEHSTALKSAHDDAAQERAALEATHSAAVAALNSELELARSGAAARAAELASTKAALENAQQDSVVMRQSAEDARIALVRAGDEAVAALTAELAAAREEAAQLKSANARLEAALADNQRAPVTAAPLAQPGVQPRGLVLPGIDAARTPTPIADHKEASQHWCRIAVSGLVDVEEEATDAVVVVTTAGGRHTVYTSALCDAHGVWAAALFSVPLPWVESLYLNVSRGDNFLGQATLALPSANDFGENPALRSCRLPLRPRAFETDDAVLAKIGKLGGITVTCEVLRAADALSEDDLRVAAASRASLLIIPTRAVLSGADVPATVAVCAFAGAATVVRTPAAAVMDGAARWASHEATGILDLAAACANREVVFEVVDTAGGGVFGRARLGLNAIARDGFRGGALKELVIEASGGGAVVGSVFVHALILTAAAAVAVVGEQPTGAAGAARRELLRPLKLLEADLSSPIRSRSPLNDSVAVAPPLPAVRASIDASSDAFDGSILPPSGRRASVGLAVRASAAPRDGRSHSPSAPSSPAFPVATRSLPPLVGPSTAPVPDPVSASVSQHPTPRAAAAGAVASNDERPKLEIPTILAVPPAPELEPEREPTSPHAKPPPAVSGGDPAAPSSVAPVIATPTDTPVSVVASTTPEPAPAAPANTSTPSEASAPGVGSSHAAVSSSAAVAAAPTDAPASVEASVKPEPAPAMTSIPSGAPAASSSHAAVASSSAAVAAVPTDTPTPVQASVTREPAPAAPAVTSTPSGPSAPGVGSSDAAAPAAAAPTDASVEASAAPGPAPATPGSSGAFAPGTGSSRAAPPEPTVAVAASVAVAAPRSAVASASPSPPPSPPLVPTQPVVAQLPPPAAGAQFSVASSSSEGVALDALLQSDSAVAVPIAPRAAALGGSSGGAPRPAELSVRAAAGALQHVSESSSAASFSAPDRIASPSPPPAGAVAVSESGSEASLPQPPPPPPQPPAPPALVFDEEDGSDSEVHAVPPRVATEPTVRPAPAAPAAAAAPIGGKAPPATLELSEPESSSVGSSTESLGLAPGRGAGPRATLGVRPATAPAAKSPAKAPGVTPVRPATAKPRVQAALMLDSSSGDSSDSDN